MRSPRALAPEAEILELPTDSERLSMLEISDEVESDINFCTDVNNA